MQFEKCLKRELATAEQDKASFVKEFSQADYDAIVSGWKVCHTEAMLVARLYGSPVDSAALLALA